MRVIIIGSMVFLVAMITVVRSDRDFVPFYDVNDAPQLFEKFMRDYHKVYEDEEDRQIHYEAFKTNLKVINERNANRPHSYSAIHAINNLADLTEEEFKRMLGFNPKAKPHD